MAADGRLYGAFKDPGILRSTDPRIGWESYANGLPSNDIRSLTSDGVHLFAATGSGLAMLRFSARSLPTIIAQPQGMTVKLADTATFTVGATNSTRLQWTKDNIPLPGATNPVLTVTNVQPPRIGDYQVVVGNAWGAVTSSVATLNIQGVDAGIWRGLVGYYPFREGARDESGFANHGTMMAGASLAPGRLGDGSSVRIDGINGLNKGVRITNSILNAGQPGYSVNLWFKTENGAKDTQTLVNTDPHCGFSVSFNYDGSARLGKWMGDGDRWLSPANYSASQFSAPKWRMMTFIKDGSRFRLFADGKDLFEPCV
jgi:hypothetical protein